MTWFNAYAGIPYVEGGKTPEGWDCFGLYRYVLEHEAGIILPDFGHVRRKDYAAINSEFERQKAQEEWIKIDRADLRPFDAVLMKGEYRGADGMRRMGVTHIGCAINNEYVLHVEFGRDTVIQSVDDPVFEQRIVGFYRFHELDVH